MMTSQSNVAVRFHGVIDEAARYIEKIQLKDAFLWKNVVSVYEGNTDEEGWSGEFWGKLMRGACIVYGYTRDEALYATLEQAVRELLLRQRENGSFTAYAPEHEFTNWDVWCRKYVMYGFLYFLKICQDPQLAQEIETALIRHADCIIEKVGPKEEGKLEITETSNKWKAVNSCSILRPFVMLYKQTKEERFLAFAEHIVAMGGIRVGNLIDLALEGKLSPFEYPTKKAYEMISVFEGFEEYAVLTQNKRILDACVKFADRVLETDFTLIGAVGCFDEVFDNSTAKQVIYTESHMQETCVTVTLMQYLCRIFSRTGNAKYIDAVEKSFYNAFLGAVNRHFGEGKGLPFDSYSPILGNRRGLQVGGEQPLPLGGYYGCCGSIGAAGFEAPFLLGAREEENGLSFSFYEEGEFLFRGASIRCHTRYPYDSRILWEFSGSAGEAFTLSLRIPSFSRSFSLLINEQPQTVIPEKGYVSITRPWQAGDRIELRLSMPLCCHEAQNFNPAVTDRFALTRGAIVYAAEVGESESASLTRENAPEKAALETDGGLILNGIFLKPYAQCGGDWIQNVTVWLKR